MLFEIFFSENKIWYNYNFDFSVISWFFKKRGNNKYLLIYLILFLKIYLLIFWYLLSIEISVKYIGKIWILKININ